MQWLCCCMCHNSFLLQLRKKRAQYGAPVVWAWLRARVGTDVGLVEMMMQNLEKKKFWFLFFVLIVSLYEGLSASDSNFMLLLLLFFNSFRIWIVYIWWCSLLCTFPHSGIIKTHVMLSSPTLSHQVNKLELNSKKKKSNKWPHSTCQRLKTRMYW